MLRAGVAGTVSDQASANVNLLIGSRLVSSPTPLYVGGPIDCLGPVGVILPQNIRVARKTFHRRYAT